MLKTKHKLFDIHQVHRMILELLGLFAHADMFLQDIPQCHVTVNMVINVVINIVINLKFIQRLLIGRDTNFYLTV